MLEKIESHINKKNKIKLKYKNEEQFSSLELFFGVEFHLNLYF